jgi:hypothetical protein
MVNGKAKEAKNPDEGDKDMEREEKEDQTSENTPRRRSDRQTKPEKKLVAEKKAKVKKKLDTGSRRFTTWVEGAIGSQNPEELTPSGSMI